MFISIAGGRQNIVVVVVVVDVIEPRNIAAGCLYNCRNKLS